MTNADLRAAVAAELELTGWRRFSPVTFQPTNKGLRVRVAWKQALAALVILPLLGWLSLATGAYLFVKYRRDFPEVKFRHMLFYPTQQGEYRRERGDFLIAKAKGQLKDQKINEAFHSVRVGASLSPTNREGRMLLAQFYVVSQRPDLAQKLLVEGIELHADNREYLQTLFSFLLQRQEDSEVLRITRDLLAKAGPAPMLDERLRLPRPRRRAPTSSPWPGPAHSSFAAITMPPRTPCASFT